MKMETRCPVKRSNLYYALKDSTQQWRITCIRFSFRFTFTEMLHASCPSSFQRDRGGNRRRWWPSRPDGRSLRGFTERRYCSILLHSPCVFVPYKTCKISTFWAASWFLSWWHRSHLQCVPGGQRFSASTDHPLTGFAVYSRANWPENLSQEVQFLHIKDIRYMYKRCLYPASCWILGRWLVYRSTALWGCKRGKKTPHI